MTCEELRRISEEYLKQLAEGKGAKRHDFTALDFMIDDLARGNHEKWCAEKRADGYVYGEVVDDTAKTTNLLVPFDKLPEAKKEDNYRNAKKTIALMNFVAQDGNSSPIMKPDVTVHGEINALYASYFEEVQYELVDDLKAHAEAFMQEANDLIKNSLAAN